MCVVAEEALSWGGVDGACCEDVVACKNVPTWTRDVIVGKGTMVDGVAGCEVMISEALGTSCVELPMLMVVLLLCVNSNKKRGWVKGV
jgi:hypothetical protein